MKLRGPTTVELEGVRLHALDEPPRFAAGQGS
jgi:hypothetical protein